MALSDEKRIWLDGGLALAWASLIWVLGSSDFSAAETSRILGPLLEWLLPDASPEERAGWVAAIRKLAHPIEYGVFAVLALRYVDVRQRLRYGRAPVVLSCVTALAFSTLLAVLDERRQATLADRTGSAFDVGLDVAGAAIAITLAVTCATIAGGRWLGIPGWGEPGEDTSPPASTPPRTPPPPA